MSFAALATAVFLAAAPSQAAAPAPAADPFIWLEDVESPRAMEWVKAHNAKAAARLEGDPRFEPFRKEALAIFTAKDRIAFPDIHKGYVYNLWQDDAHIHGIWRRASIAGYDAGSPQWETVLDLDALSNASGRNRFGKGAVCRRPAETRCLVRLSDGGGDAVEIREFDTAAKAFTDGGFRLSTAKQDVDWLDDDTIVLDRDWGGDTLTETGYRYVIKTLQRGQP